MGKLLRKFGAAAEEVAVGLFRNVKGFALVMGENADKVFSGIYKAFGKIKGYCGDKVAGIAKGFDLGEAVRSSLGTASTLGMRQSLKPG
jgi:hypothetical protein